MKKVILFLLLTLLFPAQAQMSKSAIQSQIVLNWPDNNSNAITASKLRIPNQIIVNSYLDLNGAASFQCPANQTMIGFSTLSAPSCDVLSNIITSKTGTGALVFATSPTLVTPNLGTPSVLVLTNATGLPISTGVSGLGANVAPALGIATGTAGSFVINGGALGTPLSGVGTNLTALNASNLSSGTVSSAQGGAGTINGLVKANGSGVTALAVKGTDYIAPGATGQALGASPVATGGIVMMGLGGTCTITPTVTGRVIVSFNFTHANSGITTDTAQVKFGTGAAPANNTAATGTNVGTQRPMYEPTATASNPVSISGLIVTGLTIGTAYWFDILLGAGSGSASITGADCSFHEF